MGWLKTLDYQTLLVVGFFLGFTSTLTVTGFVVSKTMMSVEEVSNRKFYLNGKVYDIMREGACIKEKR